jgi:hypothetical protein
MAQVPILLLLSIFIGWTMTLASENLETVNEQNNKWHIECEASTSKANGHGHVFRQCMKDKKAEARKQHAMNLRASLAEEMNELTKRKNYMASQHNLNEDVTGGSGDRKPHILLITTDQQRQDSIGCYVPATAKFKPQTPHIDRLAKEGMLVEDAWTASPVCSPSRTSLLLGVHVPIHGVVIIHHGYMRHIYGTIVLFSFFFF